MHNIIYTHDEAMLIVEIFEDLLAEYNISIPSPEDDERYEDDIGLYGSTYSDLLDSVEDNIVHILNKYNQNTEVVEGVFSGTV